MTRTGSEAARLAAFAAAVRGSSVTRLLSVPEGSENWRPSPREMSFADLAQHLIDADEWLFEKLRDDSLEGMTGTPGLRTVAGREEYERLIAKLSDAGDRRSSMIGGLTAEELSREVPDDRFGGSVSIWWVIVRGNLDHEIHHRGQLAAYLRALPRGAA